MDYLTTHTSLSPIWHGFAPGFVNYKKGCTRLAATSDKVYQLLAHGQWFSSASSTNKTGRHDIAERGIKHQNSNQINLIRSDFRCTMIIKYCYNVPLKKDHFIAERVALIRGTNVLLSYRGTNVLLSYRGTNVLLSYRGTNVLLSYSIPE